MADKKRKHVVIVGAGFGGVKLARLLAREAVDITVVDRNNFHLFQPLLYQLSTSELDENEIAYPIRAFFRHLPNVDFFMAHAEGFSPKENLLRTDRGGCGLRLFGVGGGGDDELFRFGKGRAPCLWHEDAAGGHPHSQSGATDV